MKVKICGMTREMDMEYANEMRPDYIGFVFSPKSRRYIAPERAALLRTALSPQVKTVGVFVNESLSMVANCAKTVRLDAVQLHGDEPEEYVCALREYTPATIIRAFKVGTTLSAEAAARTSADYILLDSGAGSGKAFDWSNTGLIRRPYFLAGGLTPENVGQALALKPEPFALDVSTGVEVNGVKDFMKMKKFIEAARLR